MKKIYKKIFHVFIKDTIREVEMKKEKRSYIAAHNHAVGLNFEEVLINACEYYKEKKIAVIEKTPEEIRVIKNNHDGTMTAIFVKKAQPDFKGTLEGGKCIIFEAKHTSKEKIQKQEKLNDYEEMGALAYVMVSFRMENFYRVPWDVFRDMKKIYGRQYLTEEDIQEYKLKKIKNYILILDGIIYSI